MPCLVFGLTGGIGSGKTTVANRWRSRGLAVLDADELAREAVAPGTEGLERLVEAFGEGILHEGALDRAQFARHIFESPEARQLAEDIVHPLVFARLGLCIATLEQGGEPLVCYEAPLLVESGRADSFRPLVVVSVPEDLQIVRAMHRDGVAEAHIRARLAAQAPLADKVSVANYVIDNSSDVDVTIEVADHVLDEICVAAGIDPELYPRPPMDAA